MKTRRLFYHVLTMVISCAVLLPGSLQASALAKGPAAPVVPMSAPLYSLNSAPAPDRARVSTALRNAPLMFIENVGQFDAGARFQVYGSNATLYLADDSLWFTMLECPRMDVAPHQMPVTPERFNAQSEDKPCQGVNLKLSLVSANPAPHIEPFDRLNTHVSYFIGDNPAKWYTDVPVWGGVRYVDLYPGIDLEVTNKNERWVWRLVCGANCQSTLLQDVRLRVEGADALTLEAEDLHLSTAIGDLTFPFLQAVTANGTPLDLPPTHSAVDGDEIIAPFSTSSSHSLPPSISPQGASDLLYSTFLGGGGDDYGYAVAVGGAGSAYVTGRTYSSDFPTTTGAFDTSLDGGSDAFVVKVNAAGTGLAYATFLGGSSEDWGGHAIAVDGAGSAYLTGGTESSDFPTTTGAFDRSCGTDGTCNFDGSFVYSDAFVVKLNANGTDLAYATFLGGSSEDEGGAITVDGASNAYVAGQTESSDFPTKAGAFDTSHNGGTDAFVVKVNASGTDLAYATFLGGRGYDDGWAIAVDGTGSVYVASKTYSSDFPTKAGAFDTSHNGGADAFVVKVNASGTDLAYATFLGGSDWDASYSIAVDGTGNAYVSGDTISADFPTTVGAFDTSHNGGRDAFVVKLNAGGTDLDYATFLGGSSWDIGGLAIAIDSAGNAHVAGRTESSDFPTTAEAFDTTYSGGGDAFVVKMNASGTELDYATFLGGSGEEWDHGIAMDGAGSVYVAGHTNSSDFPTTPGAFDTSYNGNWDAFVAKLTMGGGGAPWTFMLYLDGDNDLYPYLDRAIRNLEAQPANPNVNVVVLWDADRNNDSWRFLVQPGGNYTLGVNKWYMGELNVGDPQTLADFITWTREHYPANHYYLSIADHGRGTTGVAWDYTNNRDYLSTAELRTALNTATNSGQWKIDVLHYDACLMAMLEDAYQVKDFADYLVASQNLGWSVFAYEQYVEAGEAGVQGARAPYEFAAVVAQVTASTTPRQLAESVAEAYFNHPAIEAYPRTISTLDLSQAASVRQAVDSLAAALRNNLNSIKTYVQNTRSATQKFDSRDYLKITQDDEYLDLYHLGDRLKQYVPNGDVQTAAQGVMDAVTGGFVIVEHHQSGMWAGEEELYWDLDNAHGVSIYFPPRSGSNDYNRYITHQLFRFTAEGQWDEFLVDYFGVMGLPPEEPTDPGLPPMLAVFKVYLPVVIKGR